MVTKDDLERAVEDGLVSADDCGALRMYHYTQKAVYDRLWTPVTRAARGVIFDGDGHVVARAFEKFFNLGEMPETQVEALPNEIPELAEKMDGSLAIVFWNPETGRWQGTTKGSFRSDQARWINEKWLPTQTHEFDRRVTYLFELVAPWNRIVVTYAREEMVLIGMVGTEDGYDWTYGQVAEYAARAGLRAVNFAVRDPAEIDFADPGAKNVEGFVARYSGGLRVKMKFEQYKILHKILTGLSVKGVWEALAEGSDLPLDGVPDEFMDWYRKVRGAIQSRCDAAIAAATDAFRSVPKGCDRKTSALAITERPKELQPLLFKMLDGRDPAPLAWKLARPDGHETFMRAEE